jgi:alpha-amylase
LNSENSFVISEMAKWIKFLVTEYGFDGIRVDTVIEVPTPFWKTFT